MCIRDSCCIRQNPNNCNNVNLRKLYLVVFQRRNHIILDYLTNNSLFFFAHLKCKLTDKKVNNIKLTLNWVLNSQDMNYNNVPITHLEHSVI